MPKTDDKQVGVGVITGEREGIDDEKENKQIL